MAPLCLNDANRAAVVSSLRALAVATFRLPPRLENPIMSSSDSARRGPGFFYYLIQVLPFAALYVAAVVLVAMTETDAPGSMKAWVQFIPWVAGVSVVLGWGNVRNSAYFSYLIRQALHWGALAFIIYYILVLPEVQQFMPNAISGFTVLSLLGLTAYLAGVHTDWRMMVFGAALLASAVGIAYLNDWSLALAGIAAALVIVTLVVHRLLRRFR
jgi:hypothetical protein